MQTTSPRSLPQVALVTGAVVRFKATVKKHDAYRGTRQTVVTRLAIDESEEVHPAA